MIETSHHFGRRGPWSSRKQPMLKGTYPWLRSCGIWHDRRGPQHTVLLINKVLHWLIQLMSLSIESIIWYFFDHPHSLQDFVMKLSWRKNTKTLLKLMKLSSVQLSAFKAKVKNTHRHTSKYFIYLIYSIIVFLSIYSLAIYLSVCLFACLSVYLCICSQYKRKTLHQNSWNSDSDRESCDCWIQAILGGKDWGRQGGRWQQQWLLEHVVRIQLPTQRSTVISRLMRSLPLGVRFRA